jgi:hypothetical protein
MQYSVFSCTVWQLVAASVMLHCVSAQLTFRSATKPEYTFVVEGNFSTYMLT